MVSPEEQTNDDSVVFLLYAYGRSVLMTGDIEERAEREIAATWDLPSVDWLKVAHHGSRTSTHPAWLKEVIRPCGDLRGGEKPLRPPGAGGDPAAGGDRASAVWRTDRHGAVTVRITPSGKMRVETMLDAGEDSG